PLLVRPGNHDPAQVVSPAQWLTGVKFFRICQILAKPRSFTIQAQDVSKFKVYHPEGLPVRQVPVFDDFGSKVPSEGPIRLCKPRSIGSKNQINDTESAFLRRWNFDDGSFGSFPAAVERPQFRLGKIDSHRASKARRMFWRATYFFYTPITLP